MIGEEMMHKGELEDIAVTSVPKGHHEDLHLTYRSYHPGNCYEM